MRNKKKLANGDRRQAHIVANRYSLLASRQSGITLVIAIVMLASITFVSFSLSTIILREIGAANLILRTEPAISAADAGSEVGLYQFLREFGSISTDGELPQSQASFQVKTDLYDNNYSFSISTTTVSVSLYDATNPNNPNADYGTVTVTNDGQKPVKFKVYSFGDLLTAICNSPAVPGGNSYTCPPNGTLNSLDDRYLVIIEVVGTGSTKGRVSATNNLNQPKGVPANTPKLNITGTNLTGNVQRKIRILLGQ